MYFYTSLKTKLRDLGVLCALCALCVSFCSCRRATMDTNEARKWIAAYSPAHVDQDDIIRVEMTRQMASRVRDDGKLDSYVKLSPGVEGKVVLKERNSSIDFIPDKGLKPGKKYSCRLKMRELTGVDSLSDFEFSFFVDKREMRFADLKVTVDPENCAQMMVKGKVEYNSLAGNKVSELASIIGCDMDSVVVEMAPKANDQSRLFLIKGIKRRESPTKLKLTLRPPCDFEGDQAEVEIPATNGFVLLSAQRHETAEPYIELDFSNPLSQHQEPDGLIAIDGIDDLRIERRGANVKVYYPTNSMTDMTLRVSELLKSHDDRPLGVEVERHFKQKVTAPAVEMPFDGNILPDRGNLRLPFRAVNLAAVDVEVVKIFPANVMSFLQEQDLGESDRLRRYGRLIYRRTVRLNADNKLNLRQWQNFSVDLNGLFAVDKSAVYNIRLSFKKDYSLYDRADAPLVEESKGVTRHDEDIWDTPRPWIFRDSEDNGIWKERNDPLKESYYIYANKPEVNLMASNLGLIVKRGDDGVLRTVVTDLLAAEPKAGARVTAYNYQLQKVGEGITDENGFVDIKPRGSAFILAATDNISVTYLKVKDGYELPTTNFDVAGTKLKDGLRGFVYGDRGVWRPGDTMHLTLILDKGQQLLPTDHPVVMELTGPDNRLYDRQTLTNGVDGFYVFHTTTTESAPTGLWEARFTVGNEIFRHPVRIETIKPNRLKIKLNVPEMLQANKGDTLGIVASWLAGQAASDMNASLSVEFFANASPFKRYKNYKFQNPLVSYTSAGRELFHGKTDSVGRIVKYCAIGGDINVPGMLQANLTAKVMEKGGDVNVAAKSILFSPFGVYTGIDFGTGEFETGKALQFPVIVVNADGALLKRRELAYKVYKLDWSWWWEGDADDLRRYVVSSSADVVTQGNITAINGRAVLHFKTDDDEWGKYLVVVRDKQGGHATGGVVRIDAPEWNGRSERERQSGSTQLSFTLDKNTYEEGETANIYLPQCEGGRVLLSIENGNGVLKKTWVSLSGSAETKYRLVVDKSMAPNFYVSATLLRRHNTTDLNTPIRLFGIRGAKVVNQQSVLRPVIDMPGELAPLQTFTVNVREERNRPMTYTLAIVDEGLLDISGFRTPQPWSFMNRKQALGVRTWDMYDEVIGAFGSNFRSVLSVGGDEAMRKLAGCEKRFNPAVMFIGPFTLKGGKQSHKITMPNYVGSVRVMVVAAHEGSFGSVDKTVKVASPLMIVPTFPRMLANADTVNVPVNVFALDDDLRTVDLRVETKGPVRLAGGRQKRLTFNGKGDKLVNFCLICDADKQGKATIVITARGNNRVVTDTTYLNVSNPMPAVVHTTSRSLQPQSKVDFSSAIGNARSAMLQLSASPTVNFMAMELFMESYQHICTEQLSSKALFMLFGREFLDDEGRGKCERELPRLIKTIQSRQTASGAFVYWPGDEREHEWATSLAGLALGEAMRQGFRIDKEGFERWKRYQAKEAGAYKYSSITDFEQAMRLYSLVAAGGQPSAAMNRLGEQNGLSYGATMALAVTYAYCGRHDVAARLIERATPATLSQSEFATPSATDAMALMAYSLCNMSSQALDLSIKLASECTYSTFVTQDVALITMALKYNSAERDKEGRALVTVDAKTSLDEGIVGVKTIDVTAGKKVTVKNSGKSRLETALITYTVPSVLQKVPDKSNGIALSVIYTDSKGRRVDVGQLKQNTDFYAAITVTNKRAVKCQNLALTHFIPSGWEIVNDLRETPTLNNCRREIRDNSCNFYFSLQEGETRIFMVPLRAAYIGNYLLPSSICEDMYAPQYRAMSTNGRVEVVK